MNEWMNEQRNRQTNAVLLTFRFIKDFRKKMYYGFHIKMCVCVCMQRDLMIRMYFT